MTDSRKLDLEITIAFPDGVDTAAREREIVAAGWEDCASWVMGLPTLVQVTIPVEEIGQGPAELFKMQTYLAENMPDAEIIDVGGTCMADAAA